MSLYTLISFTSTVSLQFISDEESYTIILEKMYIFVMLNHLSGLLFGYILSSYIIDLVTLSSTVYLSSHLLFTKLAILFLLFLFYTVGLFCSLFLEIQERKRFNINKYAHREIKNTEKLLNQMIPSQVLRNLHHDITTTDRYFDVTIIYADICGFTS